MTGIETKNEKNTEKTNEKKSFFTVLSAIDCIKLVQKRNALDYLAWATTWKLLKQHYPYSTYRVRKNHEGLNYHHDQRTAWVEVELTLVEQDDTGALHEHTVTEMLAVMDYAKRSIPLDKLSSTDVINTIQRCLVKACARMGLGIAVYGALDLDDLPEDRQQEQTGNVVDLTDIRTKLDAAIKEKTKDMNRADKVNFVNTVVTPTLNGERNWKACQDADRLMRLLEIVNGNAA